MSRSVSRSRSASGRRDKKADRDRSRSRKSSRSPSPRKKEESRGKKDRRRSDSRRPRKEDRRRSRDSRGRGGDAGRERRNRGDGLSVLIRGLPDSTDKHELQDLIEKEVGEVRDVYIPKDYYTGRQKSFAFVEFTEGRHVQKAIRELDDTSFNRARISVQEAKNGRRSPGTMRGRGGPSSRR